MHGVWRAPCLSCYSLSNGTLCASGAVSGQGGLLVAGGAGAEQHDPAGLEREEVYSEEFPQLGRAVTAADLPWPPEPIDPHSGDEEPSGGAGPAGGVTTASTSKQIGQSQSPSAPPPPPTHRTASNPTRGILHQ